MKALNEKAMLASLNMSAWTARKLDKQVTQRATDMHMAASDAGRFNKQLLNKNALADIVRITGQARWYHLNHTLPWLDDGARVLPSMSHSEYWRTMEDYRMAYESAVQAFLDSYPAERQAARVRLGTMFRDSDYPSVDTIADKFSFGVRILPLPDAGDFRLVEGVSSADLERIKADVEKTTQAITADMVQAVFKTIADKVSTMVERLTSAEPKFRDTLVSNMTDVIDTLPALNITDDPRIDGLIADMRKYLTRYDVDTLKTDKAVRQAVADKASEIAERAAAFMA